MDPLSTSTLHDSDSLEYEADKSADSVFEALSHNIEAGNLS